MIGLACMSSHVWNGYHELGPRAQCQEEDGWTRAVRQLDFQLDLDGEDL